MKAIIFDLDGVIVFTDKYHYIAWKELADGLGIYFDEEINNRLRGVSRFESLEIILERYKGELTESQRKVLAQQKNDKYRSLLDTMTPGSVGDDIRETLRELRQMGYKLAIGSSSKNAGYILEKVEIHDMFDAVSDGNNISRSKPDPEVFLKAAELLGVDPADCVVVEDACSGIDAAKAAGMDAIGIGDAAGYGKTDYAIGEFREILGIVIGNGVG